MVVKKRLQNNRTQADVNGLIDWLNMIAPEGLLLLGGWEIEETFIFIGDAMLHSDGWIRLGSGNDIVRLDAHHATHRVWVGHADALSAPFRITKAGALVASNADITGKITSGEGSIGGWSIQSDRIVGADATLHKDGWMILGTGDNTVRMSAGDADWRFWVGHNTPSSAPFRIHKTGSVHATNGIVGGWSLHPDRIVGGDAALHAAGWMVLGLDNDTVRMSAIDADWRLWIGHLTPGSAPFRVSKAGAVTASSGSIGGWSISSTNISSNNLFLWASGYIRAGTNQDIIQISAIDATYRIYAGSTVPADAAFSVTKAGVLKASSANISGHIQALTGELHELSILDRITLGSGGEIRSGNFLTGIRGLRIEADGDIEVNNITARGTLHTVVFKYDEISAQAGSLIITPSAAVADADYEVGGTLKVVGAAWVFATNDILRIRAINTTGAVSESWIMVFRTATMNEYTTAVHSGAFGVTYPIGTALLGYGQGGGTLLMTAELAGKGPYYSVRTHGAEPWNTENELVRIGNLNGSYGISANRFGIGLGDYSAGNYLLYDPTTGFRLQAGGGSLRLSADGITMLQGSDLPSSITWRHGSFTGNRTGNIYSSWAGASNQDAILWMMARKNAGAGWRDSQVMLAAIDNVASPARDIRLTVSSTGLITLGGTQTSISGATTLQGATTIQGAATIQGNASIQGDLLGAALGGNLLPNPAFDHRVTLGHGWASLIANAGSATITSVMGRRCLYYWNTTLSWKTLASSFRIPVQWNTSYTASVWIYRGAEVGGGAGVHIIWYNRDGAYISASGNDVTSTQTWQKVSVTATSPSAAVEAEIRLVISDNYSVNSGIYMDLAEFARA